MAAELYHRLAQADSAAVRRRAAALGLMDRIETRNVHFEEHRAALAARGGHVTPALWDGRRLHQGLDDVLAALERMAAG